MEKDVFSRYNPIITFSFFIGAILLGMVLIHPAFLAVSILTSFLYYHSIKGREAWKLMGGMIPVFLVMSLINPVFNTRGSHVLFTYFQNRPYTLEALFYGMALGAMFVTIIVWFACYNAVMTSDKFMYLFGRWIPSISMIIVLVLRLIPNYIRQAKTIAGARRSVGMVGDTRKKDSIQQGITIVSALTSWALEGGIITADSMRSRGYGVGKRSNFAIYRWSLRDSLLLLWMIFIFAIVVYCGISGAATVTYTPKLYIAPWQDPGNGIGILAYGLFLMIPTLLNYREAVTWRILQSKI